jgi:hypothetical protein
MEKAFEAGDGHRRWATDRRSRNADVGSSLIPIRRNTAFNDFAKRGSL